MDDTLQKNIAQHDGPRRRIVAVLRSLPDGVKDLMAGSWHFESLYSGTSKSWRPNHLLRISVPKREVKKKHGPTKKREFTEDSHLNLARLPLLG